MRKRDSNKIKDTAEQHWKFLGSWLHIIYVDSFVHGWKHGASNKKGKRK